MTGQKTQSGSEAIQPWIVLLRMHSALRFRQDENIRIQARTGGAAPVHLVHLHNDYIGPVDDGLSLRGLRFDVSGGPASMEEAAAILGGIGSSYANVLSLIGNGCVGEPRLSVIYKLPLGDTEGRFFQRAQVNEPQSPSSVVRTIPLQETGLVLDRLHEHAEEIRLFRSCAHYAAALRKWHEFDALVAAESLWIAAETLGPVILRRVLAARKCTKEELAKKLGYERGANGGTKHLYDLDSHLLREQVFDGDAACFKKLKDLSHGFEHGFDDFDKIRNKAAATRVAAARYIRTAILRELDLDQSVLAKLSSEPFDEVQGGWDPFVELEGTLHPRGGAQPTDFIGVQARAYVDSIQDTVDDKRSVSIKLSGQGFTIPEDLTVRVKETKVWMAGTRYIKSKHAGSVIEVRHQDGTVEREEGVPPPEDADEQPS